jgi:hypothetical protein
VSQGWFPNLSAMSLCQKTDERPPHGRPPMNVGQTNLVELVLLLPPRRKHTHQGHAELVPKWGRSARVVGQTPLGPTWPGLGPTWPPRSVDTHGFMYINEFPLGPLNSPDCTPSL